MFQKKNKKAVSTGIKPKENPFIQPKLNVGKTGDKYEIEADKMADQVVNKTGAESTIQKKEGEEEVQQKPLASSITPLIQKKENTEEESVQSKQELQRKEDEEAVQQKEDEEPVQQKEDEESVQQKEDEESIQTKSNNQNTVSPSIEGRLKKGSGGTKMDAKTKNEMESGFGADFSSVNIHTDNEAAQMSQDIGAQAFTHGNDVYFNQGKYNPDSKEGKHLLAHELTHTVQQEGMVQKKKATNISKQPLNTIQRRALTPAEEGAAISSGRATFDQKSIRILQIITGAGVDGKLGTLTVAAISNWQTTQGIADNGIVNQATLDRMVQKRMTVAPKRPEHAIQLVLDFYNIAASDTLAFRYNATAIRLDLVGFRIIFIPADTLFETGGLRIVSLSDLAFADATTLRNTIQGELNRAVPAIAAPGATPNILTATEVRRAKQYTASKYTNERSVRIIQGLVGANITGLIDDQTVQFIAETQSNAGLASIDGKVGDVTTKEFYNQIVANGDFNSAIQILIDFYNLGNDDNLLQIYYDPTETANASTDFRPNEPVRIRVGPAGMAQSFEGTVLTIAHELEHVKQLKKGLANASIHEFLAESLEILSVGLPDEELAGFINDATRCINNWDNMPVADQIKYRRKFFRVRREVLRRIDAGTAAEQVANAALRARYVAINPPR
ncbi:MAG: DUF4157 domain-containing protein [Flavobacteriaceae bacterium]|nr:DUF4157 domain-containing protein [Flavobacteriaceae bacterium]